MNPRAPLVGLVTAILTLAATGHAWAADPTGIWLTEDKDAAVRIGNCGDSLCGRIVWLESARDNSGALRRDQENPDPAKRARRVCGLVIVTGLKPSGPDQWAGSVYDPQDGKIYSATVTVVSERELKVRGYVALPIFGRSQTWTRMTIHESSRIGEACRNP